MTFPTEENQQPNGKSSSEFRNPPNLPGTSGLCRDIMPSRPASDPYKNGHMYYSGYNNYGNHYTAYQNGSYYYSNRSYNQGYKMHRGWSYQNHGKNHKAVRISYLLQLSHLHY